jgi:putative transposase
MKQSSSYLKMRVLGAIESAPGKTQQERVEHVAHMVFVDEYGEKRQFTWRTIYTWFYRYKNQGVTALSPKARKDKGLSRKVSPEELLEVINKVKHHFRKGHYNKMALYRKAIELGLLRRDEMGQTTFYRFIREYELMEEDSLRPERLAFAMQYANQLWQGDTMFGPYVKHNGRSYQSKLIAFIDDASRVICHGEFFLDEKTETVLAALRKAFYKRGIPEQLYVDNGSAYCSREMTLVCGRIGCILTHTPVRDGAAKGKIERFFRTVRMSFLTRNLDLSSLSALNKAFFEWVENEYNHKKHSILGMKPIDRYGLDRSRIRFLTNINANDELFFNEDDRMVSNSNTFSFRRIMYEAPRLLCGKKIQIRFSKTQENTPVIVYYKNERMGEAHPVNLIANGMVKRNRRNNHD